MAYADLDDLARHGLPDAALEDLDDTTKSKALDAASSLANGYLRASGLVLPLTAWGDDLTKKVCHIATWDLMCLRGFNPESQTNDVVRQRYEDAIAWLVAVSKGVVVPDGIEDSSDPPQDSQAAATAAGEAVVAGRVSRWT